MYAFECLLRTRTRTNCKMNTVCFANTFREIKCISIHMGKLHFGSKIIHYVIILKNDSYYDYHCERVTK